MACNRTADRPTADGSRRGLASRLSPHSAVLRRLEVPTVKITVGDVAIHETAVMIIADVGYTEQVYLMELDGWNTARRGSPSPEPPVVDARLARCSGRSL